MRAWIIIYRNWKLKTSQSKHKTCVIHTFGLLHRFLMCNNFQLHSYCICDWGFKIKLWFGFRLFRYLFPTQTHREWERERNKNACLITASYEINWNVLDEGEGDFINNIKYYHLNEGRPYTSIFLMKCMASIHSLVSFRSYKIHSRILSRAAGKRKRIWAVRNLVVEKLQEFHVWINTSDQEMCAVYIKSQTNTLKAIEMRQ